MKFRTRFCSLLLAGTLILSLAACTGSSDENELPPSSDDAAAAGDPAVSDDAGDSSENLLPDGFVVDTSVEDLCLATLDVPGEFELLSVNGSPVTAYSYLYWLTNTISYLEDYTSYFGMTLDLSDASMAEYVKEDALNASAYYNLIPAKAKELGYEMTQEQIDELDTNLALTAITMGGEEAFREVLRQAGLDYDTFYEVNAASYYYLQLQEGLFGDHPTDEEMDTYIQENDILYAKHILLMTVDPNTNEPLDEAAIAQKKATAEDVLSQLQASSDLLTDFDALMNQYSEDSGLATNPDGYTFTAGEMVSAFEDATRALEFGQISGLVESEFGYHIILRLDPDTETARAEYRGELMNDQLTAWLEEADIVLTEEYQALDVALFFEKYLAYQEAFYALANEEASEESTQDAQAD